jgi:hypothetical protein
MFGIGGRRVAKVLRSFDPTLLDPALDALVRERLEEGEIVLGCSELGPEEVMLRLIRKELHHICAPIAKKFGRGAGCGRTLHFKRQDGEWVFQGVGGWIS